jgi:hypothetical protein
MTLKITATSGIAALAVVGLLKQQFVNHTGRRGHLRECLVVKQRFQPAQRRRRVRFGSRRLGQLP